MRPLVAKLIVMLAPACVWAAEPVQLHYFERPPYMSSYGTDKASGLTASFAEAVFAHAGIAITWTQTPAKRQLWLIEKNIGQDCGVGWFKTPERLQFAQFSLPIYRDQPSVLIARNQYVVNGTTLAAIFSDPKGRVLLKDGFSYGDYINGQLAKAAIRMQSIAQETATMLKMLEADRADLMIASREEAEYLLHIGRWAGNETNKQLRIITLSDTNQGDERYLMCSNKVSAATMTAINKAILQLRMRPSPR
jgi:polar amino acid transport system substrate-binding protein